MAYQWHSPQRRLRLRIIDNPLSSLRDVPERNQPNHSILAPDGQFGQPWKHFTQKFISIWRKFHYRKRLDKRRQLSTHSNLPLCQQDYLPHVWPLPWNIQNWHQGSVRHHEEYHLRGSQTCSLALPIIIFHHGESLPRHVLANRSTLPWCSGEHAWPLRLSIESDQWKRVSGHVHWIAHAPVLADLAFCE